MISFWSKNRALLAVILGLLTAFVTVMLFETIGHSIYPPAQKLDFTKPEIIEEYIKSAPIGAMIFVVLAQVLGALVGAYVSTKIAPEGTNWPFYVTIVLLLVAVIYNYVAIPHPIWMPVATVLGMAMAVYTGRAIAIRSSAYELSTDD